MNEIEQLKQRVGELENKLASLPLELVNQIKGNIPTILFGSRTIDFASVAAGANTSSSIQVGGARVGDACFVSVPSTSADGVRLFLASVTADDTVSFWFTNVNDFGGAAIDLASGVYTAVVIKKGIWS